MSVLGTFFLLQSQHRNYLWRCAMYAPVNACHLSKHAEIRMQQRAIRRDTLESLIIYGEERDAGGGCKALYFSKNAMRELRQDLSPRVAKELRIRAYAILSSDNAVLTVGHRFRKWRRS
jgi:Domain of unknown function (DUF4258)